MLRAELYIDGFKPSEGKVEEFSNEQVVNLVGNFYEELTLEGIVDIQIEVKERGLEKALYEEIRGQILRKLKSNKATLN